MLLSAILIAATAVTPAGPASPAIPAVTVPGRACPPDEKFFEQLHAIKTWVEFESAFRGNLGACSDGEFRGAGFVGVTVGLLADRWSALAELQAATARDPEFGKFVLRHIDGEATGGELRRVLRSTRIECPTDLQELCVRIAARAEAAIEHQRSQVAATSGQAAYRVEPTVRIILGIELPKLDPTWDVASLVDASDLPRSAQQDLAQTSNHRFAIDGDFNHDGHPDRAVVGVYRTRTGEEGQFLLIVTRDDAGAWSVSYLDVNPGFAAPSVLYTDASRMSWVPCTACDVEGAVSWSGTRYVTAWADMDVD